MPEEYKILKSQKRFRSEAHNVFTEKFNKIAFSANDEKRIQVADRVIAQPDGTGLGRVCKAELMKQSNIKK